MAIQGKPKIVFDAIANAFELLKNSNLIYYYNLPQIDIALEEVRITWPNHAPGRQNAPREFTRINYFLHILRARSFSAILFDGSIIRISYKFYKESLVEYNFLWWPSPFCLDFDETQDLTMDELVESHIDSNSWSENIQMRSPIRFDYDCARDEDFHPASHVHMQDPDCRMRVSHPICLNTFLKFIFCNFYSEKYRSNDFWDDLEPIRMYKFDRKIVEDKFVTLGWTGNQEYKII